MKFTQPFPAAHATNLPDGVQLVPRKPEELNFEEVPRFHVANSRWLTLGMDIFSMIVPEHERFFIETVREYTDTLKDQEEQKVLRAFIQQEAIHLKIHEDFNDTRKAFGLGIDRERERMKKGFNLVRKWVPLKTRLAMTVFMEHATASASHVAVDEDNPLHYMHQTMAHLWQWHAIEEIEHKSVAFDIYEKAGGGYINRVFAAVLVGVLDSILFSGMIKSFRDDMKAYDDENGIEEKTRLNEEEKAYSRKALKDLRKAVVKIRKILLQYFRPGFFPWELDESEQIKKLYSIYGS